MAFDASRVARLTGVGALCVALLHVVGVPLGSLAGTPGADAPGAEVLRFLAAHRNGILAAVALNGIAWCTVMPAVFVGLHSLIDPIARTAATVALVAAGVEAALIGVALVLVASAAYATPHLSAGSAKLLYDGFEVALIASAWPTLACVSGLVVAARRSGALPQTVVVFGIVVAVPHLVNAVSLARGGVMSTSGIAAAAALAFAIWMAVIGVALLRRPARAPTAAAVPA